MHKNNCLLMWQHCHIIYRLRLCWLRSGTNFLFSAATLLLSHFICFSDFTRFSRAGARAHSPSQQETSEEQSRFITKPAANQRGALAFIAAGGRVQKTATRSGSTGEQTRTHTHTSTSQRQINYLSPVGRVQPISIMQQRLIIIVILSLLLASSVDCKRREAGRFRGATLGR